MLKTWRPCFFKSVEEVAKLIKEYKDYCNTHDEEIPDVEGLAYFMSTTRKTLNDYARKPEFSATIKEAKTRIAYNKKQLAMSWKLPTAVFCFDFKNNHWYVDKQEITTKTQIIDESDLED